MAAKVPKFNRHVIKLLRRKDKWIERKPRKMTTELVCRCGARLKVSVKRYGWWPNLVAVATASLWKLPDDLNEWADEIAAYCPTCRNVPSPRQCQRRDC